jgi:CDP-paratose 2-epimerase
MRILITGACGFVGSTLARTWSERGARHTLFGLDNLSRPGSEINRPVLRAHGVTFIHADVRLASDVDALPEVDWVVEAAANPSVLAGVGALTSPRQLVEHNLIGTLNMLEFCRRTRAGFLLLSTSRVYSIRQLSRLPVESVNGAFRLAPGADGVGLSPHGIGEAFSTEPPISLYGATKLASEQMALEYGAAFDFPVWINRCGVLAGPGQFGRADQGIFSYWIHSWIRRQPLRYIGFNGTGAQVRDCLHPRDLVPLLERQMAAAPGSECRTMNVSGGQPSAVSLRQCSEWCEDRFGPHTVSSLDEQRPFDIPWLVLDSRAAHERWAWAPETPRHEVFEAIARHAEAHPHWLAITHD